MQVNDKLLQQYIQEKLTVIQDQNLKTILEMKPGDIMNARLLQHNGQEATVEIMGKRLNAELQLGGQQLPAPGSEIKVQVTAAQDNKLVLKLLDAPQLPGNRQQLSQEEPLAWVMRLGLPVNNRNLQAVETMLAYRIPVTVEHLTTLLSAAAQSANNLADGLDTAAFLLSRNLPLLPELGRLTDLLLHQGKHLQSLLENAISAKILAAATGTVPNTTLETVSNAGSEMVSQAAPATVQHAPQPVDEIVRLIERLMVKVDGQGPALSDRITNFVRELSLGNSDGAAKELLMLTQAYQDALPEQAEQLPVLKEKTGQEAAPAVSKIAAEVLNQLTAQQLINKQGEPLPYLYFQLPCNFNGRQMPGEVFVFTRPRPHRQRIDPNDLRLVFCLDTPGLGMVKVDLSIKMQNLALRVGVTDEQIVSFVNKHIGGLVDRLQELRYQVTAVKCFVDQQTPFTYVQNEVMSEFSHVDLQV